jgi:hypothetical protein
LIYEIKKKISWCIESITKVNKTVAAANEAALKII